jgi:DNA-directed RNA polymerase specialized sigma24 family protein
MNAANVLLGPPQISDGEAGVGLSTARSAPCRLERHSDAALVRLAQAGDDEALDVLLLRHQKKLLVRARRHCGGCGWVDDLCQEICWNLVSHLPDLREPDAFAGWMQALLANTTRHCRRKNCKKVRTRTDEDGPYQVEDLSVEATCVADVDWRCLWELLWKEAGDEAGQRGRVAAFMLEHYTRQESFPSVQVIVQALKISHWSAQKCRVATLLTWRRLLRAAGFYP